MTHEITIYCDGTQLYLVTPYVIFCENTGYTISAMLPDDWSELPKAKISYFYHGAEVVIEKIVMDGIFSLDKLPNVDSVSFSFRDTTHNSSVLTIPCRKSIIDTVSIQEQPVTNDVYNYVMGVLHERGM